MENHIMIPTKDEIQKAVLFFLEDNEFHTISEVTDEMAKKFNLTDTDRKELTPVAKRPKFDVKVRWAVSELRKAILLKNKENELGIFKITQRGLDTIKSNPPSINKKYLMSFDEYKQWLKNISDIKKSNQKDERTKLEPKFGLVSYIDMLGTRELWKKSNQSNIPNTWNKFVRKIEELIKLTFKNSNTKITFNSFSDTIIITLENKDVDYLLKNFGKSIWSSITQSIEQDIAIRGCFSIGKFFHKKSFFIGEAISEAAGYYELPQWIGISATPSANEEIEKMSKKDPSIFTYYHKYPLPLKNSIEQEAWTVKWPELYDDDAASNENYESSKRILDYIDKNLAEIKDIDIALKWRNTRKFYNDIIKAT